MHFPFKLCSSIWFTKSGAILPSLICYFFILFFCFFLVFLFFRIFTHTDSSILFTHSKLFVCLFCFPKQRGSLPNHKTVSLNRQVKNVTVTYTKLPSPWYWIANELHLDLLWIHHNNYSLFTQKCRYKYNTTVLLLTSIWLLCFSLWFNYSVSWTRYTSHPPA